MQIDESWYVRPDGVKESDSAGGVIYKVRGGHVYVALVQEDSFNAYILPKGKVEPGEDLEQAARREIAEEAGFKRLVLVEYLGTRERLNYRRDRWVITHYFLFRAGQRIGAPTDPDHAYRCQWFRLDRLPEMFWPEQRELVISLSAKVHDWLDQHDQP